MGNTPVGEAFEDAFVEAYNAVTDPDSYGFIEDGFDGVVEIVNMSGDFLEDIGAEIGEGLEKIGGIIFKNTIGAAEEAGKRYYYQMIKEAEAKAKLIRENAQAAFDEAVQQYEQYSPGIIEQVTTVTDYIDENTNDFFETIDDGFQGTIVDNVNDIVDDIEEVGQIAIENIEDTANMVANELESVAKAVEGIINDMIDFFLNTDWGFGDILDMFNEIWDFIKNILDSGMSTTKSKSGEKEYKEHEKTKGYEKELINEDGAFTFNENFTNCSNGIDVIKIKCRIKFIVHILIFLLIILLYRIYCSENSK